MNYITASIIIDSLRDLWNAFLKSLPSIITGLVMLLIFYVFARVVRYLTVKSLKRMKASEHAGRITGRLVFIAVMALGILVSLGVMGVNSSALVASLGLVSVGLGFAMKDVIENFMAGLVLIFQKPFVMGDVICFGDVEGTVEDVRVRDTVICMFDGRQVFVPNSKIFSSEVINNDRNRRRRLDFEVGIAYAEDVPTAMEAARDALAGVPGMLAGPAPLVIAEGLGDSAVVLKVYFWIDPTRSNFLEARSAAVAAVKQGLQKAGIEIPFPIITVRSGS